MKHDLKGSSVLVTGGAGFIGSHLVRALLARGAERIVVIDSLRYGDKANLGELDPRIQLVQHSLGSDPPDRLGRAMQGVQYLFHLAAEKHNQSKDDPARVYRANIEGMHALLECAQQAGVKKTVFSSSLYAYGRLKGAPFVESEIPEPSTVYGITKLAGEHMLRYFEKTCGMEWNVLRYLFIYGPKQFAGMGYKSVIMKSFERLLQGQAPVIFGDGSQAYDYVYVDDAVEATLQALEQDAHGQTLNVASGQTTTVRDLVQTMIEIAGGGVEAEQGPADWTAGTSRVGDPTHMAQVLGWRASTSVRAGLTHTYEWLRTQG